MENLRRAKELPVGSKERLTCMAEALKCVSVFFKSASSTNGNLLRLFDKGITNMSLHALSDVVAEFRELKWPIGTITW